jgi:hypothetical protein
LGHSAVGADGVPLKVPSSPSQAADSFDLAPAAHGGASGSSVGSASYNPAIACRRILHDSNETQAKLPISERRKNWSWGRSSQFLTIPVEIQEKQKLWVGAFLFAVREFGKNCGGPVDFCTSASFPKDNQYSCCHQVVPFGTIVGIQEYQDVDNAKSKMPVEGIFDHLSFGHGRVTIRIDLSKSLYCKQNADGWIEIILEGVILREIRLRPTDDVNWNPLRFFYEDVQDLFECCSLFVSRLRDASCNKHAIISSQVGQLLNDGLPAEWSIAPRKNSSVLHMASLTDAELFYEYEAMKLSLRDDTCSWIQKQKTCNFCKIRLGEMLHVLQKAAILNFSHISACCENEVQRLVDIINRHVMMRYFRNPSDFDHLASASFVANTKFWRGLIFKCDKLPSLFSMDLFSNFTSDTLVRAIQSLQIFDPHECESDDSESANTNMTYAQSLALQLNEEQFYCYFHRKLESVLDPKKFAIRQKFRSRTTKHADITIEKIQDEKGITKWKFKSIGSDGSQRFHEKVKSCQISDLSNQFGRVFVPLEFNTTDDWVSGYYERVVDDTHSGFYRRLNSDNFSPKFSAFEMFLFRVLEPENNNVIESEEVLNCIIHQLAALIDKKRMINPDYPLVSTNDVPCGGPRVARPIGINSIMLEKVHKYFFQPSVMIESSWSLFNDLLHLRNDSSVYHRIWRRVQFRAYPSASKEYENAVTFDIVLQPGAAMRDYIHRNVEQDFVCSMSIESEMFPTRTLMRIKVSVLDRNHDEDLRVLIRHEHHPNTVGIPLNFTNSLDVFLIKIRSLEDDGVLDDFYVAINQDRNSTEKKSFRFVGYPFLYAYSIITDEIFSSNANVNFKFREECFRITGIQYDYQRVLGFTQHNDSTRSCNYWLQPEDDLFFHADSSVVLKHKLFKKPLPGSSFYVADASFFDPKFGITTNENVSGIWRLDVEFQDFYRCLALRFASVFRIQDDFQRDDSLSMELFVDCILNCHGSTTDHLFKARIHSAIKILDDLKRSQFGKLFDEDRKFTARLQLVSLAICTHHVKHNYSSDNLLKTYFEKGKKKLDNGSESSSKFLMQNDVDEQFLKRMPMHKKAMLVFLVSSQPQTMPNLNVVFADDDMHGCSTFLSDDVNNVANDIVNLKNAFEKCTELWTCLWAHENKDNIKVAGHIQILPEFFFIVRRLIFLRHAYAHRLPFAFVSRQEIQLIFDDFDVEVDRLIFQYLDPSDYRLCESFQKNLLSNSCFFDIKRQNQQNQNEIRESTPNIGVYAASEDDSVVSEGYQRFADIVYSYLTQEGYTSSLSTVRLSYLGLRPAVMQAKPQDGYSMKYHLQKFPESFKISGVAGTLAVYAQLGEPPGQTMPHLEQTCKDAVKKDISAENFEFLKQFSTFPDMKQHATRTFLAFFSFMNCKNRHDFSSQKLTAEADALKSRIDKILQVDQSVTLLNVCTHENQLLGLSFPKDCMRLNSESFGAYHHSASFDCMQLHEILGRMFVATEKAEGSIGFKLLLSFCCASFYKALSEYLPPGQQELPDMITKVLNLERNPDFLQQSGSVNALLSLFDAIADAWSVTLFNTHGHRPFVFVIDNIDWLDYHHFKVKFRIPKSMNSKEDSMRRLDERKKLDEMRDYLNLTLGGAAQAAVEYNTNRLIVCGDVDHELIQADLQERFGDCLRRAGDDIVGLKYLFLSEGRKFFEEFILIKAYKFKFPVVKFVIKSSFPIFKKAFRRSHLFGNDERLRIFNIDKNFFADENIPDLFALGSNSSQGTVYDRNIVTLLHDSTFDCVCSELEGESFVQSVAQAEVASCDFEEVQSANVGHQSSISCQSQETCPRLSPQTDAGCASDINSAVYSSEFEASSIIRATQSYLQEHGHTSFQNSIPFSILATRPTIKDSLNGGDLMAALKAQSKTFEIYGHRVYYKHDNYTFLDHHRAFVTGQLFHFINSTSLTNFENFFTVMSRFKEFCRYYGPENFCKHWGKYNVKYTEENFEIRQMFRRYLLLCISILTAICRNLKRDTLSLDSLTALREHTHTVLGMCQAYFPVYTFSTEGFVPKNNHHVPFKWPLLVYNASDSTTLNVVKKLERSLCFDLFELFTSLSISVPAFWFIFALEGMQKSNSPLVNSRALSLIQDIRSIIRNRSIHLNPMTAIDINHSFLDPASYMFSSIDDFLAIQVDARAIYVNDPPSAVVFAKNWLRVCTTVNEEQCALNWMSSFRHKKLLGDLWCNFCRCECPPVESFAGMTDSMELFSEAFENWITYSSDLKKSQILEFLITFDLADCKIIGHFIRLQPDPASAFRLGFLNAKYRNSLSIENCNDLLKSFEITRLMLEGAERKPWQDEIVERRLRERDDVDVILSAPYGSGKTAACIISIVAKMAKSRREGKPAAALFLVPEWTKQRCRDEILSQCTKQNIAHEGFDFHNNLTQTYNFVFLHWAFAVRDSEEETSCAEESLFDLNVQLSTQRFCRPQVILSCWQLSRSTDAVFRRVLRNPMVIACCAPPITFAPEEFFFDPPINVWSSHPLLSQKLQKGRTIVFVNDPRKIGLVESELNDCFKIKIFCIRKDSEIADILEEFMSSSTSNEHGLVLLTSLCLAELRLSLFGKKALGCSEVGCVINYQIPDTLEFYEYNCSIGTRYFHSTSVFTFLRSEELFEIQKDLQHEILNRLNRFPEKHASILSKFEEHLYANMQSNFFVKHTQCGGVDLLGSLCFVVEMLRKKLKPNPRTWTILMTNVFRSSTLEMRRFALPILRVLKQSQSLEDTCKGLEMLCGNSRHPLQRTFTALNMAYSAGASSRPSFSQSRLPFWNIEETLKTKLNVKFRQQVSMLFRSQEAAEYDELVRFWRRPEYLPKESKDFDIDVKVMKEFEVSCIVGDFDLSLLSEVFQKSFTPQKSDIVLRETKFPSPKVYELFGQNASIQSTVMHSIVEGIKVTYKDDQVTRYVVVSLWDDRFPGRVMIVPEEQYPLWNGRENYPGYIFDGETRKLPTPAGVQNLTVVSSSSHSLSCSVSSMVAVPQGHPQSYQAGFFSASHASMTAQHAQRLPMQSPSLHTVSYEEQIVNDVVFCHTNISERQWPHIC